MKDFEDETNELYQKLSDSQNKAMQAENDSTLKSKQDIKQL